MPRLALRPVWALEPIEVAIQLGHQVSGSGTLTMVDGAPFGSFHGSLVVACLPTAAALLGSTFQDETASRSCCVPPYMMLVTIIYYKNIFIV